MYPLAESPLSISTLRSGEIAANLPLDVLYIIFLANAALRHEKNCPSASHYDVTTESAVVRFGGRTCNLTPCPHECSPPYYLVFVCKGWYKTTTLALLWSTVHLRVDSDYSSLSDIGALMVYNRAEYEFCVKHSGRLDFKLSIGCDADQEEDSRVGMMAQRRWMRLNVGDVLTRLTSLCFDGSNGRLMAALGDMEALRVENVYILGGAPDNGWPSDLYLVKNSPWMNSGSLKRLYCSFEFSNITGPLTIRQGYENLEVLDLSCAGSYHESAVEWVVALAHALRELRIHVSVNKGAHPSLLPGTFYALRGVRMPARAISRIRRLRITHYIGVQSNHMDRGQNFLARFAFPNLEELVIQYCHNVTFPCNVSWLMRLPFPSLTTLQLTTDSISHDLLTRVLHHNSMPALRHLIFAPHKSWDCHSSWGSSSRARLINQDNSFLRALENASPRLEVVKVGGDVWFDQRAVANFRTSLVLGMGSLLTRLLSSCPTGWHLAGVCRGDMVFGR